MYDITYINTYVYTSCIICVIYIVHYDHINVMYII